MFYKAMTSKDARTENGMPTHSTSGDALVDLFFFMGGARNSSDEEVARMFSRAYAQNAVLAIKAMFYNRDVRGGQGERHTFRVMLNWLATNYPIIAKKVIHLIPEYGRWDDLFSVFDTEVEVDALQLIVGGLLSRNALCAKWMPREGKKGWKEYGTKIVNALGVSPMIYRKILAQSTRVVETQMCKNQWDKIEFSHVPSVAHNRYRNAFVKHARELYAKYLSAVKSGEAKINASAIFPHDIVHRVLPYGVDRQAIESADLQWKALPDYVPDGKSFIPVCDVSGSMTGQPMEVSVALGIYLSERNKGAFKDLFFTFSGRPKLVKVVGGNIREKAVNLRDADWGGNTNIEAMFRLLVEHAKQYNVPQSEMPDSILIISDMQFDECVTTPDASAMEMIRMMYAKSGYTLPQVIFWNVRNSEGVPVKFDETGTALVSGFSPSIMKTVLSGELSPLGIVLKTLNQERYEKVGIAVVA